ncbi:MAG: hypothetical protein ACKO1T_07575 [Sediminibacterium sp.]|jgi:hypothetical protein
MTIDQFKLLSLPEKLKTIRYDAELLGSYERNGEQNGPKTPGDIYSLHDFWVFLSDDETMVIPSRRNPLPTEE